MAMYEIAKEFFETVKIIRITDPELGYQINRIKAVGDPQKKYECLERLAEALPNEEFSLWISRPNHFSA